MVAWQDLPWKKIQRHVFRLQKRIYQATQHGQVRIARKLQQLLVKSWYARLLAVRRITHIPADYVVTPRCSHNSLDLAIRYPHDVSSAPMAISTEGEIWNNLPKRHAKTAPSPSISRTHAPTSD